MKLPRRHFYICIFIFICFFFAKTEELIAQSSGLRFLGQGHKLNDRTSLELFPKKPYAYSNQLSIEFDLSFVKGYNSYFGYIFRMHNEDGIMIDMIYEDLHDVGMYYVHDLYHSDGKLVPFSYWKNRGLDSSSFMKWAGVATGTSE